MSDLKPIANKTYCSNGLTNLMVRKRPYVVHGGGFVVTNYNNPKSIFTVDGCGVVGTKGELVLRDEAGVPILRIQKKVGVVQVLSNNSTWKGYLVDEHGSMNMLVFHVKEPRTCISKHHRDVIKISVEPNVINNNRELEFGVHGSFANKSCVINDSHGTIIAQVFGTGKEMMNSRDFYRVLVQQGYDQAFVIAVLAVLDNIHGESTRC